ncbi:MAG: RNase adapter RapZ, partial [Clostridia bacterium]|nr:RNase adapter RapZ [Clostridia bacterium]
MQTVIITGMSGAGKSSAVRVLEDIGYYCIDNIPPTLISKFIVLCQNSNFTMEKIAFVADARSGELITHLADEIDMFKKRGNSCTVVFLDAEDAVLIKRYKETRRKHPHMGNGRIKDGIQFERALMSGIRSRADLVIDTTHLLTKTLREKLFNTLKTEERSYETISVNLMSFGFKRGIPLDCDLVFDVRFMPNPFYVDTLKELTGKDPDVAEYALS